MGLVKVAKPVCVCKVTGSSLHSYRMFIHDHTNFPLSNMNFNIGLIILKQSQVYKFNNYMQYRHMYKYCMMDMHEAYITAQQLIYI